MKKLFESWKKYINENMAVSIKNTNDVIDYVRKNSNLNIFLDNPKGTTKKFGGVSPTVLPFDYGEWTDIINPADGDGWDLIIVPSATKDDKNLLPVGYVHYHEDPQVWKMKGDREPPENIGANDKIIIAPNELYTNNDRETIDTFFDELWQFEEIFWLK